jgi:hypothetical protein
MSKKLIAIMVLAFVVGITAAAFAEVQNVKVSGDVTAVALSRESLNFQHGQFGNTNQELSANNEFASHTRIKIDANLTDNVDVTVRLLNERVWGGATGATTTVSTPTGTTGVSSTSNAQVDVDLAYITLKEFMKSSINVPLTLVAGRQNIKIGSGLLIGAAGTNQENNTSLPVGAGDFSYRSAFDAIVGIWDFIPELSVITGFVKASEGLVTAGKDNDVYVVDASYKLGENAMDTVLEGTYALSHVNRGNVNNYGGRVVMSPMQNTNVEGEYVYQVSNVLSKTNDVADALRLGVNLGMPDVAWKPAFGVDYMKLSKYWNPMHESLSPASLANLLITNTNLSVVGVNASAKPMDDLMLKLRYANLAKTSKNTTPSVNGNGYFATNSFNAGKKALGFEVDAGLVYDYTSDVQLGLDYGILKPGKASVQKKAATQVIGSMKVSF